jgi:hypothetical protein
VPAGYKEGPSMRDRMKEGLQARCAAGRTTRTRVRTGLIRVQFLRFNIGPFEFASFVPNMVIKHLCGATLRLLL